MTSTSVPMAKLGKNGPLVPALGFGLMGLSHSTYGGIPNDEERFAILDRAYELGCRFWDSSDLYGDSEELLCKWFKRTGKRDEIFLSTKFGFVKGSPTLEVNSTYEYTKTACDESLKILGVDCIDLYYMHHANHDTPIEQTMRGLAELQKEGKIKYIGLSAVSSATLRRAVKIATVDAVQLDYSVFVRDIEGPSGTDLLATCRELGIAVVCAMPLGRGMITSTFAAGKELADETDKRPMMMPRFMEGNKEKNVELMSKFKHFADKKGCSMSQLALAWLLKQGSDIIPIPGTKRMKYLEENWASINVKLSDEEEAEIRKFGESNEVAGSTVPPQFKDYVFTDTVEES